MGKPWSQWFRSCGCRFIIEYGASTWDSLVVFPKLGFPYKEGLSYKRDGVDGFGQIHPYYKESQDNPPWVNAPWSNLVKLNLDKVYILLQVRQLGLVSGCRDHPFNVHLKRQEFPLSA